jgi:hypothetical protein
MRFAEPLEPIACADLLVGGRREDEVARRAEPLAGERGDRDRVRRHVRLHVERAATPDLAAAHLAGERVHRPFGRVGEDDVRVAEQEQGRPVARAPDPGDDVRALGDAGVQLALQPVRLEIDA